MTGKVARFIERYGLLAPGDKVVVAVSGGVDSCVLLDILLELVPEWHLSLIVAHLNHALRGEESDRDESFVGDLARASALPFEVDRLATLKAESGRGRSIQVVARTKRYAFLDEVRRRTGARVIALGHTRTDQAETVLMRLLRGTGVTGLAGIPPVRDGTFVRPLLAISREEIAEHAHQRGLNWVEDSSNFTLRYGRNRVRHTVLPALLAVNPQLEAALARLAEAARRDDALLQKQVGELFSRPWIRTGEHETSVSRREFLTLDPALRYRFLGRLTHRLTSATTSYHEIGHEHLDAAMRLIEKGEGSRSVSWPGGLNLLIRPDLIVLTRGIVAKSPRIDGEWKLDCPGAVALPSRDVLVADSVPLEDYRKSVSCENACWLDAQTINLPLVVRFPRQGDRFHPLGAPTPTRLSEFLIRRKVPRSERSQTVLVLNGEHIVWIAGLRSAEQGKVSAASSRLIRLQLINASEAGDLARSETVDRFEDGEQ